MSPYQEDGPVVTATKTRKDLDKAAKSKEICFGGSLKLARRRNERHSERLAQMMRPPKPRGSVTSGSHEGHRTFEEGFLPSRARTHLKLAFSYFFSYFNRDVFGLRPGPEEDLQSQGRSSTPGRRSPPTEAKSRHHRKNGKLCPSPCLPSLTARDSLSWSGSCVCSRSGPCLAEPGGTLTSDQISRSVVSDSLRPRVSQHANVRTGKMKHTTLSVL